jgi:FkbM family methyltransferase
MPLPKKLFTALDLPVTRALLRDAGLTFVDIGGRGSALDPLLTLAPFARYVVSEPDAAEARRLESSLPREAEWQGVTVFDRAIASREGEVTLRLTAEPGMSSLLDPDPAVTETFPLASKFEVSSRVTVPAVPLDMAASRYAFEDAAFLKLDTQGTELDILQSGPQLVAGLLGVFTEVSFRPFYRNQALFADVDAYLRGAGFSLCSMNRTLLRRARFRPALYSRRMVTWAHCLYLREPASLLGHPGAARRLARLLGLSLAFQHFDLAFETAAAGARAGFDVDAVALESEIECASQLSLRYLRHKLATASPAADGLTASSARDKSHRD